MSFVPIDRHMKKIMVLLALGQGILIMHGCKKEEEGCGATNISAHGKTDSHNAGKNCMSCHVDGGDGKGCFNVAGTVFNQSGSSTAANGTVRLYTGENGTGDLRATIEVDARGNFHTTAGVDFSGGLYPVVANASGTTKHMSDAISNGACNSCHGASTDRITVQ